MRQRRRAERHRSARPALQDSVQNRANERRYQKILRGSALVVGVALLVLLVAGWYFNFAKPPNKVVANLNGQEYLLRDVAPIAKLEGFLTGQFNPNVSLNTLIKNDLLQKHASSLGINFQSEQVDEQLIVMFEKATEPSDRPTSLSADGQEALEKFVGTIGISSVVYKNWIKGQLLEDSYFDLFLSNASKTADQVFVEWIVTSNSLNAEIAYDRISSGEDFNTVAKELNIDNIFAGENGVVGWVPKGALLEMDPYFFGSNNNTKRTQGPIATSLGSIIFRITDSSTDSTIAEDMRSRLAQNNFQSWMDQKTKEIEFTFNNNDIKWVLREMERDYE